MKIRLIAGRYGGRKLETPNGDTTHPMGERIRSALFNSIQSSLADSDVLDVFAGTGALGLEALSRGAKSALFVERDRIAQRAITHNIEMLGLDDTQVHLVKASVGSWIETTTQQFDIIFVDPPYHQIEKYHHTISRLFELLKPGALMILSKPGMCPEVAVNDEIVVVDNRSYSDATLTYYRRKT